MGIIGFTTWKCNRNKSISDMIERWPENVFSHNLKSDVISHDVQFMKEFNYERAQLWNASTAHLKGFNFTDSFICKLFIFVAACLEPLGLENFQILDSSFSSSSYYRRPTRGRLGYYKMEMWVARYKNLDQFLQVTQSSATST